MSDVPGDRWSLYMAEDGVTPEMVERAAKAMLVTFYDGGVSWSDLGKGSRESYRNLARAALSTALDDGTIRASVVTPTWGGGGVIVVRENRELVQAARDAQKTVASAATCLTYIHNGAMMLGYIHNGAMMLGVKANVEALVVAERRLRAALESEGER